jgi:hypothetical protein
MSFFSHMQEHVVSEIREIQQAIASYADAYAQIQHWQEQSLLIPRDDQKTGCIGEFYAYLYLQSKYPGTALTYGGHSNKAWDIAVGLPDRTVHIQTKTVSAYSVTRRRSPLHHGWDELFVVYLSRAFQPLGFWVITDTAIVRIGTPRTGLVCPKIDNSAGADKPHPLFGENRIGEFNRLIAVQTAHV